MGCYWKIGNWRDTSIWKQPWLPDEGSPFIQTPVIEQNQNMKVCDLINLVLHDWDVELLNTLFIPWDVGLILKILVAIQYDDKWCWRGDIRGSYTVKHGYPILSIDHGHTGNVAWSSLWKMEILPLFRFFYGDVSITFSPL